MQKSGSLPCEKSYFKFHVFFTRDWNMNQILSLHRKNTSIVMGKVSATNQMAFTYLKTRIRSLNAKLIILKVSS